MVVVGALCPNGVRSCLSSVGAKIKNINHWLLIELEKLFALTSYYRTASSIKFLVRCSKVWWRGTRLVGVYAGHKAW